MVKISNQVINNLYKSDEISGIPPKKYGTDEGYIELVEKSNNIAEGSVNYDDIEAIKEKVTSKYDEIKDLEKPKMGVSENIEKEVTFDEMEEAPNENCYYIERGVKVVYKDGGYQAPEMSNIEGQKSLWALVSYIGLELKTKISNEYHDEISKAQNNEEKRVAVNRLIEKEKERNLTLNKEYFINNDIYPGDRANFKIAGLNVSYTIGENYEVVFNMESLYHQAGCLED